MELLIGLIIDLTVVTGKMGSKMGQESIVMVIMKQNMVFGQTVKDQN